MHLEKEESMSLSFWNTMLIIDAILITSLSLLPIIISVEHTWTFVFQIEIVISILSVILFVYLIYCLRGLESNRVVHFYNAVFNKKDKHDQGQQDSDDYYQKERYRLRKRCRIIERIAFYLPLFGLLAIAIISLDIF